jgi:hypothetical protein
MDSVANILIDVIIFVLNNTILRILPTEISNFSLQTFSGYISSGASNLITSWSFINNFFPVNFLLSLLGIIIVAEITLHFGFKGIKYIINVFRGSGG